MPTKAGIAPGLIAGDIHQGGAIIPPGDDDWFSSTGVDFSSTEVRFDAARWSRPVRAGFEDGGGFELGVGGAAPLTARQIERDRRATGRFRLGAGTGIASYIRSPIAEIQVATAHQQSRSIDRVSLRAPSRLTHVTEGETVALRIVVRKSARAAQGRLALVLGDADGGVRALISDYNAEISRESGRPDVSVFVAQVLCQPPGELRWRIELERGQYQGDVMGSILIAPRRRGWGWALDFRRAITPRQPITFDSSRVDFSANQLVADFSGGLA